MNELTFNILSLILSIFGISSSTFVAYNLPEAIIAVIIPGIASVAFFIITIYALHKALHDTRIKDLEARLEKAKLGC